jgi:SpoVK/Ycf46/Vps4 family AAA+-type ATPase
LWTTSSARLALLQGLMDSDGTVDQRGGVVFSSTSRALADAVVLLVQSFGGVATVRERVPTYTYLGESRLGRLAYEVRISVDNSVPLFRLARKADRVVPRTKYFPIRLMTEITPDGREEARCLRVAATDHLYVSEQFIVTHNTLIAQATAGETGRPFVFVEPGAFINMFMGIGVLKVKSLYRKLRKLSLRHGGVIVFFDEADALGSRGQLGGPQGQLTALPRQDAGFSCNGYSYLSSVSQQAILGQLGVDTPAAAEEPRRTWRDRIMMGGMMGGGGMGTLQALLTEMNGLTKPRGFTNRLRKMLGFRPKPAPKYRILHIMATNMPNALDEAMLRPGRIDRIYKVGFPSKEGRKQTIVGYLNKVEHVLTEEQVEKLATVTPYYSGAKIKDMVNEALIIAVRDGRDAIEWPDIWKAKALKELGPPEDVDYIQRERHAVAIHEASHAVAAHLLGAHRRIDLVSIEKRASTLGMVKSQGAEERFTQWKSEFETDIMVSLASLAGERMFFEGDNSSGVSGDLSSASTVAALMEGTYGMGAALTSALNTRQMSTGGQASPVSIAMREHREAIEKNLATLYDRTASLLDEHRDKVLELAAVLEERKNISGDEVAAIMGSEPGSRVMREPKGWQAVSDIVAGERQRDALEKSGREAAAVSRSEQQDEPEDRSET